MMVQFDESTIIEKVKKTDICSILTGLTFYQKYHTVHD